MVDCREARELTRIALDMITAKGPRIGPARTAKIDSWLSGLPAPRPSEPMPAQEITARADRM